MKLKERRNFPIISSLREWLLDSEMDIGTYIDVNKILRHFKEQYSEEELRYSLRYLIKRGWLDYWENHRGNEDAFQLTFNGYNEWIFPKNQIKHSFKKMKNKTRQKISQKLKGRTAWNKEIGWGVIEKKKISISKKGLLNFIQDQKTKSILTRDYAYAEICKEQGMFKPAIILYGSIIEEILRYILKSEDNFSKLINKAQDKKLIEASLIRKIDFIRDFRDYVHIFLEIRGDFEPKKEIASIASEVCNSLCKKLKK